MIRTVPPRPRVDARRRHARPSYVEYRDLFDRALTVLEEAMAGDGGGTADLDHRTLVTSIERAAGGCAPLDVRRASTSRTLHSALLRWQDRLEIRDGRRRREPVSSTRRPLDRNVLRTLSSVEDARVA